jgi:NAD-dependent deacetylase
MPYDRLTELLARASKVLAFTGAGVSTASSIPDFRGPEGVWRTRTPVQYPDFIRSEDARVEYWSWKLEGYPAFRDAKPNLAHESLVRLERLGKLEALVTQNIDGLHRLAGTSPEKLVELHGTGAEAVCTRCAAREPMGAALQRFERTQVPPTCPACSAIVKPAVVMFGESLDPDTMRRASAAARRADLVLSLGSSLTVTPAADVPLLAVRHGAPYVIVNRGATPHDSVATLTIDDDVGPTLDRALGELS